MMNYQKIVQRTTFFLIFLFGMSELWAQEQLAFPGAEGYGKYASGGRGNGETGRVVEVTSLEDDLENPPEGSFRWAFTQGIDTIDSKYGKIPVPRPLTVVFRVGGVINLKGELRVNRSNITIAGHTAPGDGICFRGATVNFSGSSNVIVRYLRSRPGDELGLETSAFRIENGGNFIIDHCSFSWAIEETTHFSSNNSTTVQWCIISESLYNSIHKKGARGYGTQWGGEYASYHHNLLAHHNSRMPRINGSNENDREALVDYRNNINYNWGSSGAFYGGEWEATNGNGFCATNVVNNYFKPGPATDGTTFARPSLNRDGRVLDGYADWYFGGNIMDGDDAKTTDNWLGVDGSVVGGIENIRVDEITYKTIGITGEVGELEAYESYTETAAETFESVLNGAGATLPKRDEIDERVVGEVRGETPVVRYEYEIDGQATPLKGTASGIIDTQKNLVPNDAPEGTTPWDVYATTTPDQAPLDTDHDGIPDEWEMEKGLNKEDVTDGRLIAPNGYSNLENYLYGLDEVATARVETESTPFRCYPNPLSDKLYIDCDQEVILVELLDLQGRKVKRLVESGERNVFNIGRLASGYYVVKATLQNGVVLIDKVLKK